MRHRTIAGLAGAIALLTAGSAVATPTEPIRASYDVYFGGLHLMTAEAELVPAGDRYRVLARGRTRGLLDVLFRWTGETVSEGRIEAGRAIPVRHRNWGESRRGERLVQLGYAADGTVRDVLVEPEPDLEEVNALPEGAADGTVDPLSVIAELSQRLSVGGACAGGFPVFDGRRRYDLRVTDKGWDELSETDYSVFVGKVRVCEIGFDLLGGDRREKSKYARTARDRLVYVATPFEGAPAIPVGLRIETDYGTLMGHLTGVTSGDRRLVLARN